ncbi:hypothetical protein BX616_002097 [Lobosporangium transversale]|uniref:GDP dissociation inhibitor-domain-containing protein n=1 Tax=Lobosporangium transversale TaxID=64571 RepID=A0A1Y2H0D1_9FUNG|nr:GDP dissociation inhibitor-domain-containing protein [Lobosporangium transversale]KAF9901923.1 hypothetical protein BX616_002097 [Lobosporangium transversale]ORZ28007.1 GDP dissociation inhibitor-domain-containing protein [Lobosporangium transversale]|eukprot:XP_021885710.1 GDP dissociation inhibitor-domain-containing protein [Lobosporangium transversale]
MLLRLPSIHFHSHSHSHSTPTSASATTASSASTCTFVFPGVSSTPATLSRANSSSSLASNVPELSTARGLHDTSNLPLSSSLLQIEQQQHQKSVQATLACNSYPISALLTPAPHLSNNKTTSYSPTANKKPLHYSYSFMADIDKLDKTVFDAIILGTGFTQTIVAAALARAGKTVLHLDENDYYGGESGAFGFRDLLAWADKISSTFSDNALTHDNKDKIEFEKSVSRAHSHVEVQLYKDDKSNDTVIDLASVIASHKDSSVEDRIKAVSDHITTAYQSKGQSKEEKEAIHILASWASGTGSVATAANFSSVSFSQVHALEEFLKTSRKYNFDLSPKLLYSRGSLTNLLISSGIGKYLEFKLLERTAVYEALTDKVEMMPTSKEDVFVSKALSLKEKRQLMRFLQFAVDYENQKEVWRDYKDAPFTQFVQNAYGLSDKVLTAVVYAIGFDGNDEATTTDGLKSVKVYLQSLGRYGNSAYLCPLYGVGSELAQAFCRVSAVYGGIYMLQHELDKHNVDRNTNQWKSVVDHTGQALQANQLICTREYLSRDMDAYIEARTLNKSYVSHCILVTDRSAFGETTLCKTLFPMGSLVLNAGETPARKNEHTISVLQLCGGTMSCPTDRYILYFWAESDTPDGTAKEELTAAIRKLVHIPGDPLSLKAPSSASASESEANAASATAANPAGGSAVEEAQPRMSLDQELDMDQVHEEILKAEKKLFEEIENNNPVAAGSTAPASSSPNTESPSKALSTKAPQNSKSSSALSTVSTVAPRALFSLFYKRTTSWPRVPYPIGSENLTPLPENITVLKPMNHSLDFEAATEEARVVFERLCPGEEFLPPTPDPEEGEFGY